MLKSYRCSHLTALLMLLWASSAWALSYVSIDAISSSPYPRITMQVSSDEPGMGLENFSATENGIPVTLLPLCFETASRPVDIVFVVDVSRSMEEHILAVSNGIASFVHKLDSLRPEIDFRFGLVTYGQNQDPNAAEACPDGLYYGGPRNRTINGLWTETQLTTTLSGIANGPTLAGGNEPAYHAIHCALNSSPWTTGSERKIVIVSDENNDYALDPNPDGAGCSGLDDPVPFYSLQTIIDELQAASTSLFVWANDSVFCDGHDNGDGIEPENLPCGLLNNAGCTSGYVDFKPIADSTGGCTVLLSQPADTLFECISLELLTTYFVCYNAGCCAPGVPRAVVLTADFEAQTASDNASYTVTTCPPGQIPQVTCWTGNPTTAQYGEPVIMCATVTDGDNNVTGVTASFNTGPGCNQTIPATFSGGRWCATIPGSCTQVCPPNNIVVVTFRATDACGLTDEEICTFTVSNTPPIITCRFDNPTTFVFGQPVTLCAQTGDLLLDVVRVDATYSTPSCLNQTVPATLIDGYYCINIPASCTRTCAPIVVTFIAYNECNQTGTAVCTVTPVNTPPTVACFTGNPASVGYGLPLTVCAQVSDAENNVTGVTGSYNTGAGCVATVAAIMAAPGRWCITVPGSCTMTCTPIRVTFTATDTCGRTGTFDCTTPVTDQPPVVTCVESAATVPYGQSRNLCVTVTDPENNVDSVVATYNTAACPNRRVRATLVAGQWCVTIPGTCTQSCSPIAVRFTAYDACLQSGFADCGLAITNLPPFIVCDNEAARTPGTIDVLYGQVASMFAAANDPDGNLVNVSFSWTAGPCDSSGNAVFADGHYGITIPPRCTEFCGPNGVATIPVTFVATDACGLTAVTTCTLQVHNSAPELICWDGNPLNFSYGQPLTMCALVSDFETNLSNVTFSYSIGAGCALAGPATNLGGGRWCVTIPDFCTETCENISVTFRGTDACGLASEVTCSATSSSNPPTILCWPDNPIESMEGDPVVMCALASDPDDDVRYVWASYNSNNCPIEDDSVAATFAAGRWCITIPGTCTEGFTGDLRVVFTVEDYCGHRQSTECLIRIIPRFCYDLGDLKRYPTDLQCEGGPAHGIRLSGDQRIAWLGTTVDCDSETGEDSTDHQDDGLLYVNDPDFCERVGNFFGCREITLEVNVATGLGYTNQSLTLSCWYDANGDHDWDDSYDCVGDGGFSEWLIQDQPVVPGVNAFTVVVDNFTAPEDGAIALRFRLGVNYEFGRDGYADIAGLPCSYVVDGEVEDYNLNCPRPLECCFLCAVEEPVIFGNESIENPPSNLVIQYRDGRIRLSWNEVAGTEYYQIYRGDFDQPFEEWSAIGFVPAGVTSWSDPTQLSALPIRAGYQVAPYVLQAKTGRTSDDIGRWDMNEGEGECTADHSGINHPACRPECAEPSWGFEEEDEQCEGAAVGFMHFSGYRYIDGDRCAEHLVVENDHAYYTYPFQVWTRIRIAEQPTVQTGAYYIVSNNSFDINGGGFALRIDPGWYTVNGVRHYHNRLTGLVWNEELHGWMTLQSPAPTASDPDRWSVPLNQWSCVCMVVNGNRSMLIIDGRVVAAGDLRFDSANNWAPLIIGAGYRHNTYPIEYPFRGDIDCVRISSIGTE